MPDTERKAETAPAAITDTAALNVAVVGAGTMGRGIAQVAAQAGFRVLLYDVQAAALARAREGLEEDLRRLEAKGKLSEPVARILERLSLTDALEDLGEADWVVEAAPEDLELKRALLRDLAEAAPQAVLASNTSTFSVTVLGHAAGAPQRVVGLHFFNPAPLMRLVEVIPGRETSEEVVTAAVRFAERLGKTPAVARDAPGFIVNRVARPFYGEALRLHGEGVAVEAIDRVMRGLGFKMGPFELMDLIGLDVNLAASVSVYEASFHEPRYRPSPLQRQLVEAGHLGRKSGRGFYRYPREEDVPPPPERSKAPPKAWLVGDGDDTSGDDTSGDNPASSALVAALKERLSFTERESEASLILDARLSLTKKSSLDAPKGLPVVTAVWGHSASLALEAYGQERPVAGFSLVPPLTDSSVAEILAPASGDNAATAAARAFFEAHEVPCVLLPDTPGGVGLRVLAMLVNEAVSALAEGVAEADALDRAMRLGTNYPLGPLEWSERLGLASVLEALEGLFAELGEDRYRPHPLLRRSVAAGVKTWRKA